MLACEPLAVVKVAPKVQAHLSAFSRPSRSNQAPRVGSVTVVDSSLARVLAMASAPGLPFGLSAGCHEQADGQRSALPTKMYRNGEPSTLPVLCWPQYAVQKPEVAVTSAEATMT